MKATEKDKQIGKSSLNFTITSIIVICVTACFCFSKMESTTAETEKVAQLSIDKNRSETALLLAKKGIFFEYRPIVVSSRSVSLNTAYQPSATRFVSVSCSVSITSTLSLSGGQSGTVTLQSSPDNITYTTIATTTNNNTGSLTLGLNTSQGQAGTLTGTISPGYYYKVVSSGTSTFSILQTFETQL